MLLAPALVQILRETVGRGRKGTQLSPFSRPILGKCSTLMIWSERRKSRALSVLIRATSVCLCSWEKLEHSVSVEEKKKSKVSLF